MIADIVYGWVMFGLGVLTGIGIAMIMRRTRH